LGFDASSVQGERIKEEEEYKGVRVRFNALLGSARISLQVDIGFGDAITPEPSKCELPCILDAAAPILSIYPWETVVAEKFHAIVKHGMLNSRMKDFFDLQYMARYFGFNGALLAKAVASTFERRRTDVPDACPLA
jgi:hypothetical protein